jgi:hypothetical protein
MDTAAADLSVSKAVATQPGSNKGMMFERSRPDT